MPRLSEFYGIVVDMGGSALGTTTASAQIKGRTDDQRSRGFAFTMGFVTTQSDEEPEAGE